MVYCFHWQSRLFYTNEGDFYDKNLSFPADTAHFRFGLIAPAFQHAHNDVSDAAYFKRITKSPIQTPSGEFKIYSYKTLQRWLCHYKNGGMDALMPSQRRDKGQTRTLSDATIERIYQLKKELPRINGTQIHDKLITEGLISADTSLRAVQRFIKNHNLKPQHILTQKDRKAFEMEHFGDMWQADTCHFPYIDEHGKKRKTYLMMIIDDHSRLIVAAKLFYHDSAANFQSLFKEAVAIYGIPKKLYLDNGAPYANNQLKRITASIGTIKLHAKPRDGAAKAKVERAFRTIKERFLYTVDVKSFNSLSEFNSALTTAITDYNTRHHSGINDTPINRFLNTKAFIKTPESKDWLDNCFLNRIKRKVKLDSTVSIQNVLYDVPMQFIGETVDVHFSPQDPSEAFIFSDGIKYSIHKTNKADNAKTKRKTIIADFSSVEASHV